MCNTFRSITSWGGKTLIIWCLEPHSSLPLRYCFCVLYLSLALLWLYLPYNFTAASCIVRLTLLRSYSYLQLNANMPEIQHMLVSLVFPKLSFSYCQALFPWVLESPSPLDSIALSLGPITLPCPFPCVEACGILFIALSLNKYEGPHLIHEDSTIIPLHSITLMS